MLQALDHDRHAALDRIEAPRASREQLLRVHSSEHVDRILASAPQQGTEWLDADTAMSPGSTEAALRAAGAMVAAVDAVLSGATRHAFCAVRPPGHHATRDQAMGFCLFNNIAVGAAHALAMHGLKRVAIADFDVHHGNGTQAIFEREPRVLFTSSHQSPLYPGSGREDERGVGNIVNGTLSPGAGSHEFRELWDGVLLPRLHAFKPQLVLVSAGFDAHRNDPLADIRLGQEDYAWITERLVALAGTHAGGRLISTLEGGYDLVALAACVSAHAAALDD
ncbi:histone deacetylase family protein [Rhodanobacter koreensis]